MRRIDPGFDLTALDSLFPSLEHEPWLEDFARALRDQIGDSQDARLQVLERVRADHLLVFALPPDPASLTLVLDGLCAHAAELPEGLAWCCWSRLATTASG